jgi:hypothetical protein
MGHSSWFNLEHVTSPRLITVAKRPLEFVTGLDWVTL